MGNSTKDSIFYHMINTRNYFLQENKILIYVTKKSQAENRSKASLRKVNNFPPSILFTWPNCILCGFEQASKPNVVFVPYIFVAWHLIRSRCYCSLTWQLDRDIYNFTRSSMFGSYTFLAHFSSSWTLAG